jgi:hypothetical protein
MPSCDLLKEQGQAHGPPFHSSDKRMALLDASSLGRMKRGFMQNLLD